MARVIGEARPNKVFVENSPLLTSRGLDSVLWDLAEMGYDARWGTFTAKDEGAQIERERIFIAGTDKEYGKARVGNIKNRTGTIRKSRVRKCPEFWLQTPSNDIGMGNGLAYYMDAVGAIGNGQVPSVVRCAWRILSE
jgi:DNA (cytosine-5)-methyltransferase 1